MTKNHTFRCPPITDLFPDIVHIHSGTQIRIYLTTISAPALSFTGSVLLKNFKVDRRKLKLLVHIDWHNCLLLYNNFIIPLPDAGTALFFQNLLTDLQRTLQHSSSCETFRPVNSNSLFGPNGHFTFG